MEKRLMNIETCKNEACGKKFSYSIVGKDTPGTKESEECRCPYCHTVAFSQRISGVFITSKIDPED